MVCNATPASGSGAADGEIVWPVSTARATPSGSDTPASPSTSPTPGKSPAGRPDAKWYRAIMLCVFPPPKLVCNLMTGSPPPPESRRAAPTSRSRRPSVRYVRAKNPRGSRSGVCSRPFTTSNQAGP